MPDPNDLNAEELERLQADADAIKEDDDFEDEEDPDFDDPDEELDDDFEDEDDDWDDEGRRRGIRRVVEPCVATIPSPWRGRR